MADTIWESYRPELERLYIHEGHKLSEVRKYIQTKYGFDERSVHSYPAAPTDTENLISKEKVTVRKILQAMGPAKNHSLTSVEGKFIGRRINKRKREYQKESEVTPEGIVVCTPATPLLKPGQDPNLSSLPSALAVTSPQSPGKGEGRRTALQHAMNNGNIDLINLLDHGANVNSAPSEYGGATALQIAAIQGYLGIARKLIDLDADVNAAPARLNGRTALEGAAEHGRIDMLRLLLDEGASLVGNYGERQYWRAVELAEGNGHMAAAKLLTSFKDKVEESGNWN
ncbi:hypothetical protein AKAW_03634 [Aspergillus luchuensis IFO 4308]|nr:hypothetical protein AKAW_03634 [Aspergillus luchuensis IFO 4308]